MAKKVVPNYLSPLNIPNGKKGEWEVKQVIDPPNKEYSTANFRCSMFGGQKAVKVSWPHETKRHYLKQNGSTWMSDIPCEYAQMLDCIKVIRGHVLIGGLGLGLVATLLGQKKQVKSITIVEMEQDVIDLVQPHLVLGKPSTFIHEDLFNFLKTTKQIFDHAFYDIWCSDGEGTFFNTVCPLYELSKTVVKNIPVSWNEDVMRGQLFGSLTSRILFVDPKVREHLGTDTRGMKELWEEDSTQEPWHNWSVPFFKFWKEVQPKEQLLNKAKQFYASWYGRPGWQTMWNLFQQNEK